jgi:N-acetylglucosaminyl-diphospho-decaprenol L-rhamnosyltransferase
VRGCDGRVAVVVVTRNRLPELLTTLGHLRSLPESPRVVVVDNASTDATARTVRERFPEVGVVALPENVGGAGRNVGVRKADAPYVAFADDDSWWAPGSLSRAADLFDAHPRLGLVAARTLVGPEEREDPINANMEHVPLPPEPDLPGPPTLGFLACASVVRRVAYLEAGGFKARMMIGGEEELLAADMAAAGWGLAYVAELTAHHHPSTVRDRRARRRGTVRNALWFAWLRRPFPVAVRKTLRALSAATRDPDSLAGLLEAVEGLPWALKNRKALPPHVEEKLRALDPGP